MSGNVIPLGVQGLYFVILTRVLGAGDYGEFVGIVALASLIAPFVGLGAGTLLIRDGARAKGDLTDSLGPALFTTLSTGLVAMLLFGVVARAAYGYSVVSTAVIAVGTSELLIRPFLDIVAKSFQAIEQLRGTALVVVLLAATRLLAAAILLVGGGGIANWYVLYFVGTLLTGVLGLWMLGNIVLISRVTLRTPDAAYLKAGLSLALSGASHSITSNTDKVMLLRWSGSVESGVYGAAVRLIEFASTPFRALQAALYARFFREGEGEGVAGTRLLAAKYVPLLFAYGVLTAAGMWVVAPAAGRLLGESYVGLVAVIRAASILPLLRALHGLAADALTGADRHGVRTGLQIGSAIANVGLNILLIPTHGIQGAVVATIAADGLLAISMWLALWRLGAKAR